MKIILRLLLGLCLALTALYAATPLWLPGVISRQLPDDWQLGQMKTAYPGVNGINIRSMQLSAHLPEAELEVLANDIHFSYRRLQSRVGSIAMDIFLPEAPAEKLRVRSLYEFSVPLITLPGSYQQLSVDRLNLTIHQPSGDSGPGPSFEATFKQLNLAPYPGEGFHLTSEFDYGGIPLGPGWLEMDMSADTLQADLQFPAAAGVRKWLTINARQQGVQGEKVTEVRAKIATDSNDTGWLDPIVSKNSGGRLSHVGGQLDVTAMFSGAETQRIQQLSLDTDNLQLVFDGGSLDLSSRVNITRDDSNIIAELAAPVRIRAVDSSGKLDQLLRDQFPEIQRLVQSQTRVQLELNAGSRFIVAAGDPMSISFHGGARLDMENDTGSGTLTSDNFAAMLPEFPNLRTVVPEGRFSLDWKEQSTVTYETSALRLSADTLSISAEVESAGGRLVSDGNAALVKAKIDAPETSFERAEVQWRDMDLGSLTGSLELHTDGLRSVRNGKTWSGFDVVADSQLSGGNLIEGSGTLLVKQGPDLPMQFHGSIEDQRWNITVPATGMTTDQLHGLLNIAQIDLPAYLVLSDGYFDLAAELSVTDDMTATMAVNGHDIDVSVNKSLADNMKFSFTGQLQENLSGSGPVSIGAISLAGGLDITALESNLVIEHGDSFMLRDLKADLFEGRLNLEELRYTGKRLADTTVRLSNIDLGKLLEFANINGLNGSGLLDIKLPVTQEPGGLAISNGTFQSGGPGFLAYDSGGMSTDNIGLQALQNFQYKQLSGTISYQPDGTYLVTVQLEGANPDLYDGYPVKFNLNINGSLPEVFESLFVTGNFEEAILKELKKR